MLNTSLPFFEFCSLLPVFEFVVYRKPCQLGILNSSMNDQVRHLRLQVRSRSVPMGAYDSNDNEFSEEYLIIFMFFKVKDDYSLDIHKMFTVLSIQP